MQLVVDCFLGLYDLAALFKMALWLMTPIEFILSFMSFIFTFVSIYGSVGTYMHLQYNICHRFLIYKSIYATANLLLSIVSVCIGHHCYNSVSALYSYRGFGFCSISAYIGTIILITIYEMVSMYVLWSSRYWLSVGDKEVLIFGKIDEKERDMLNKVANERGHYLIRPKKFKEKSTSKESIYEVLPNEFADMELALKNKKLLREKEDELVKEEEREKNTLKVDKLGHEPLALNSLEAVRAKGTKGNFRKIIRRYNLSKIEK